MIKIKNHDKNKQKIEFDTDMSIALANAIRRSVLEIPVLAIDEIEIVKNDSALYDEIIAHRLGLVPIKTGKAAKETKFSIKAKGPCIVDSGLISPSIGTDYKLPITILNEGHELEIIATANLGKGVEHIKYSPGLIYYIHNVKPELLDFIEIDDDGNVTFSEREADNKKISEENLKEIKKLKKVDELHFTIESWGQLDVKEIFSRAIEVLEDNLKKVEKAVK